MTQTKPITAKVNLDTIEEIERRAAETGLSKSQLMAEAIAQYLSPTAGTPPPAPEPEPIDPDTRLSIEQMAEALGVEFKLMGTGGVMFAGEPYPSRGAAYGAVTELSGWVFEPGIGGGGFAPPRPPEPIIPWQPDPNFVAIGAIVTENQLIGAYRMETKGTDRFSPIYREYMRRKFGPPPSLQQIIIACTNGCFDRAPASNDGDGHSGLQRCYVRVR